MGFGLQLVGFAALDAAIDNLIDVQLGDDAVYVVGTNVEYAVYQEFGTQSMEPQSFLFPAAREAERSIGEIARDANSVDEAVERVALWIEGEAADRAPVDTGNLQASISAERLS